MNEQHLSKRLIYPRQCAAKMALAAPEFSSYPPLAPLVSYSMTEGRFHGKIGVVGGVAEWLMALVLKTSIRKYRRFESCPFRQISESKASFGFDNLKDGSMNYCFVVIFAKMGRI